MVVELNINLKELLKQKEDILKKISVAENEVTKSKYDLKKEETRLWTDTPFKEKGYTNNDSRRAFVQRHLVDYKLDYEQKCNCLRSLRRDLDLCNDKIKLFS